MVTNDDLSPSGRVGASPVRSLGLTNTYNRERGNMFGVLGMDSTQGSIAGKSGKSVFILPEIKDNFNKKDLEGSNLNLT